LRIVLATFGSLGDLHPVIALGLELQARGHQAAIATSDYHRERILATGLGFHPAAPDLRPDDNALIRATMDERRGPAEVVGFMLRHLRQTYADYERAVAANGGADLIVTSDLAYAGVILAQKTGMRWASQVLSPISFLSAYDQTVLPPLPWLSHLRALGPGVYGSILGIVKRSARTLSTPINDFRRTLGLTPVRDPFFDDKHAPALVLAMFSRLLGLPRPDWPPQAVVTGFAFYDGHDRALAPETQAFIADGERPIVFTLGSAAVFDPGAFFDESARAAKALGRRALLVVGPEPGMLRRVDRDLATVGYAPFSKLFPEASVVVHQGGSGTTGQALRAGRPMVIVPYAHDQPDNAARAKKLGVSETVRRGNYRADRVARALRRVSDDPAVAARAKHVGGMVAQENGAKAAADAIERVFLGRFQ
jgi:UDP:flavonoid glycosyltransferase YjiC (YdhE family)